MGVNGGIVTGAAWSECLSAGSSSGRVAILGETHLETKRLYVERVVRVVRVERVEFRHPAKNRNNTRPRKICFPDAEKSVEMSCSPDATARKRGRATERGETRAREFRRLPPDVTGSQPSRNDP